MDARALIDDYRDGKLTFDVLLDKFKGLSFTKPTPILGDWGKVYAQAEELPAANDVPSILSGAVFARIITADQEEQLLKVWRSKVAA